MTLTGAAKTAYNAKYRRARCKADPVYAEHLRECGRSQYRRSRAEALAKYGPACKCCGEAELLFLAIDHVNDDGAAHRREHGIASGTSIYAWLKKNDWPAGFQVLCHNCNNAKAHGGCPHNTRRM